MFGWIDRMKPEGITNFWTEYDAMLKMELENIDQRSDLLKVVRYL